MAIKIPLPFPTTYLCEVEYSSYTSTKTTKQNILNAESNMRIQLSSIKPDTNEIFTNVKQRLFFSLIFFLFWKIQLSFIKMLLMLTCNGFVIVK